MTFLAKDLVSYELANQVIILSKKIKSNENWLRTNLKTIEEWVENDGPELKQWLTQKPAEQKNKKEQLDYRLPNNLKPVHYNLTLRTFIPNGNISYEEDFEFEGKISISYICSTPTNKIVFHSQDLTLNEFDLIALNKDENIELTIDVEYDIERSFVTLTTTKNCELNAKYILDIHFDGKILNELYGFYKSSYVTHDPQRIYEK